NRPVAVFLDRYALPTATLWPEGKQTLYHAKLWCVGSAIDVLEVTRWMFGELRDDRALSAWHERQRHSLAELIPKVNHERLLSHRDELERLWAVGRPSQCLAAEPDLNAIQFAEQVRGPLEAPTALYELT